jgi:alpha-ketoglutarate-dependent taurine dioxygenase
VTEQKRRSLTKPAASPPPTEVTSDGLVVCATPVGGGRLPLVMRPYVDGVDLAVWAGRARNFLRATLVTHGAILFRGFGAPDLATFGAFVRAVAGEPLEYRERSSPRTHVADRIYTSTEYPSDQPIFLHNENSYAHTWPALICFACVVPAQQGGETPLADCRRVFAAIDPAVRRRFIDKKVLYVRNFSDQVGLSWQTVFGTSDRAEVEARCRAGGYEVQWTGASGLRTRRLGPAALRHPRTGEWTWFNHATFFHVSTLPDAVGEALRSQFADEDLPNNTYYGDGTAIEPEVLERLRDAYRGATVKQPWQAGDVLLVDNVLVAHGREPFVGPRQIRVAMAEPCTDQEF